MRSARKSVRIGSTLAVAFAMALVVGRQAKAWHIGWYCINPAATPCPAVTCSYNFGTTTCATAGTGVYASCRYTQLAWSCNSSDSARGTAQCNGTTPGGASCYCSGTALGTGNNATGC